MQNEQAHLIFNKEPQLLKVKEIGWGKKKILCHTVDSKENSVYKSEKKESESGWSKSQPLE